MTDQTSASTSVPFWLIGIFVLLMIALVVCTIACIIRKRKKKEYDERQLLARNTAFKYAFSTLIIYNFICGEISLIDIQWAYTWVQMFLGAIISIGVFTTICIVKDAYFTNRQNKTSFILAMLLLTLSQLFMVYKNLFVYHKPFVQDGMINPLILWIASSLVFFSAAATTVIKEHIEKKAEKEE